MSKFRTYAVAALLLSLLAIGAFAAMAIGEEARGEAAQETFDGEDSLAVEEGLEQVLQPDEGHDPTAYGEEIDVEYQSEQWNEGDEYEYDSDEGTITFLVDEDDAADVQFSYEVPENELVDEQATSLTEGISLVALLGIGLAFVSLFLFVLGFVATRMQSSGVTGR